MSKRSLFWGQASGKLGEAVYYRAGGEQRTRTYVKTVKNPKTREQIIQRIKMANIVSMFRSAKPVLSKSFPSKNSNQSDFNKFASLNIGRVRALNQKYTYQEGMCFPQNMYVSDGDINIDTTVVNAEWTAAGDDNAIPYWYATVPGIVIDKFSIENDNYEVELTTGADVYKYLVGNTNPNGLPGTFVFVVFNGYYADEGFRLCFQRVLCSATSTDVWRRYNQDENRPWQIEVRVSEDVALAEGDVFIPKVNGKSFLSLAKAETDRAIGDEDVYGCIIAWTENGKQRVTRSVMQTNSTSEYLTPYLPGGEFYDLAIQDWGATEGSIISTK